jgi:UDP-N-acetylmuramate dehydrogenase
VGDAARRTGLPVLVVGRGSNLLVADEGFHGIAVTLGELHDSCDTIDIVTADHVGGDTPEPVTVRAGAAAALPVVARRTVSLGLAGFEWAVGVPGSVGGAVRMNAGGHGSDMAASLHSVWVLDLHRGIDAWLPSAALGLRFRGSDLADHQVVLSANLTLRRADAGVDGEALLADIVRWRREHQPGGQNAGSVFVNPVPGEVAAAQLIDGLGLRGYRIGGAYVSDKHANFIQAGDDATAADVRAVMEHVCEAVREACGVLLRSEVKLVGFGDDDVEGERTGVCW